VCRNEFRALQLVLNTVDSAPVPERGPEYGGEVWQRIEKRIGRRAKRSLVHWWMWAPAMAVLVIGAFLAGRLSNRAQPGAGPATTAVSNQQIRERILMVAVGDHLERSQMVLAELSNAPEGKGKLDISDERQMAADLLDDNRLYRQTAASTGDKGVASVLDDLENVLMEIAHSPSEVSNQQLDDLRQQIQERGLLFKVRVLGSQVREQESKPATETNKEGKKL
jgi:polyhydroxyalkanoate synthesis regulator phasin